MKKNSTALMMLGFAAALSSNLSEVPDFDYRTSVGDRKKLQLTKSQQKRRKKSKAAKKQRRKLRR